ncbi:hypothetical protein ColTof3_00692 [Colletotrichum tofieldiae]|nr:hypothetical protein ColTof3_00692 [Colletotrichum tofieldiae]
MSTVLVGNLFFNPLVQAALDGQAIASTHATEACLVLVAATLSFVARGSAAVVKTRVQRRQANCAVVLPTAVTRSQEAADGGGTGTRRALRVAVRDAGGLLVARDGALRLHSVDQLDFAVLGEVLSQSLLSPCLIQVANVHIARSPSADGKGNGGRKGTGVLAPANLQSAVVDHQALQVAESVEGRGSRGVDKGDEADVLVRDVTDVVKKTTANNVADLLDRRLGVDVAQVDGAVSKIVDTTSGGRDGSRGNGLLSQGVGDDVAVCASEHMRIARRDAKVLSSVLLLRLRNVSTSVLAVVNATRGLPLRLLRKLGNCLDRIGDGQEVNEGDTLFANNLDRVNGTKLSKVLAELLLGNVLRQVTQVHIAGST